MCKKNRTILATDGNGATFISVVGMPEPVAHPLNCRNECPYGKDRAFCFPCYAKIVSEQRNSKTEIVMEVKL